MIKYTLAFLLSITAVFILSSCNDNPTAVGLNLLQKDYLNLKHIDSYQDSLKQTSSYYSQSVPMGNALSFMVGKKANVQASALVSFSGVLTDTMGQDIISGAASVTYSNVILIKSYLYGDSNSTYDFSVHNVLSSWDPTTIDGGNVSSLQYDQSDISSNKTISDSLTSFQINNSVTTQWLKHLADTNQSSNYGIYITPNSNCQRVEGYQNISSGGSGETQLIIVVQKSGVYSDTLYFYPMQSTTVVTGSMPTIANDEIAVQGGLVINSKLWFDVSTLPKHAVINNATLTLTEDTLASIKSSSPVDALILYNLTDSSASAYDSTNPITVSLSGNSYSVNIAPFVQNWVDKGTNEGILIMLYDQIDALDLYALKGSNAADRSLRPRLTITYTSRN